jgi:hypothetical protein
MASCWEALQRAVRQHGEAAICARYHLPDDVNFDTTWHRYDARIPAWSPDPRLTWTSRGTEMVSGFRCEVHEGRFDPPNAFATKSKDGRSIEGIFPRVERVWVEPRTKLILRSEVQEEAVNGIKMIAANRRHFVKKLRFPERLPASLFELPPGVTVRLPGVLKDMPLPKGTRRVLLTGKFAETSIDPKRISQKARQKP